MVIRERVEVSPAGVPLGADASVESEPPAGFGFLTLRASGGNPVSYGVPITAVFYVSTTRPSGAGLDTLIYTYQITNGFEPVEEPTGSPYQRFTHSWQAPDGSGDGRIIDSEMFAPGERVIDAAFVVGPQIRRPWGTDPIVRTPWDDDFGATIGCNPSSRGFIACADAWPHAMKYANFGVSVEMEGIGRRTVIDIPDEVECGTSVPARILRLRPSGLLGWWPHEGEMIVKVSSSSDRNGRFRFGDVVGQLVRPTYGEGLTELTYEAAPCHRIPAGGWSAYVETTVSDGGQMQKNVRTVHQLELLASPATLRPGEEAQLALATTLPQSTPVTLSVDPAVGGFAGAPAAKSGEPASPDAASLNPATLSATVGDLVDVRFVAAEGITETVTTEITAVVGGRTVSAVVTVEPAPVALQLLSQNDEPYPLPSAGGAIMVSRFPTDLTLPEVSNFDSGFEQRPACPDPFQSFATELGCFDTGPPAAPPPVERTTDRFTVRPELSGLGAGADVSFQMTISRPVVGGLPVQIQSETYSAVQGGTGDYRGDRLIRFVSNARPQSAPSNARYDDAVGSAAPDQTPVVRLGDTVRFEALASGAVVETLDYTVGRPASETGPLALRRVTLNWRMSRDLERGAVPDVIANRASEDWAQAAIAVVNKPPGQRDALWGDYPTVLSNVIHIRTEGGRSTRRADSFVIPIVLDGGTCTRTPTISYGRGATPEDLRNLVVSEVQAACGVRVSSTPDEAAGGGASNSSGTLVTDADAKGFFVTVGAAHRASVDRRWIHRSGRVTASSVEVDTRRALSLPAMGAVAAALRDDDPSTVDVIALPDGTLFGDPEDLRSAVLGFGFDDSRANSPLRNVLFVGELNEEDLGTGFRVVSAIDDLDDSPLVVGHELGHVLAGAGHPNQGIGAFGVDSGHPLELRHIMATTGSGFDIGSPEIEFVGGPKRMNETFVGRAWGASAAQLRGSGPPERRSASATAVRRVASTNQ